MTKIGFIAGTFDVLHPGYIKMFKESRSFACDKLYVLLNSGSNMEQYDKPDLVCSLKERRERLESIRYIDGVIPYNSEEALYTILKGFADEDSEDKKYIRILGSDYLGKDFTGINLDMDVYFLSRSHDWSTTRYKKLIAESFSKYKSK